MNEFEYGYYLSKKEKRTEEEKIWLATHSLYSNRYGYPILLSDFIALVPNKQYSITVKLEYCNTNAEITPTIEVPLRQGFILSPNKVVDVNYQNPPSKKRIHMLSTYNDDQHPESVFLYKSNMGGVKISYHCEAKMRHGYSYLASSTFLAPLGMKKEVISENKCIYHCNDAENENFDSYAFSVQYNS